MHAPSSVGFIEHLTCRVSNANYFFLVDEVCSFVKGLARGSCIYHQVASRKKKR